MRRKLFLHIGCHRTATTSIQKFMVTNFEALISQGILVPYRIGRHFDVVNRMFSGHLNPNDFADDINRRADSKHVPIHSFVMSDEDICTRQNFDPLISLSDHFDINILWSIRRQDLWLESWYLQNIKWQWNPELAHASFPEFLKHLPNFTWLKYADFYEKLKTAFPHSTIKTTVFDPVHMPDGPIAEFKKLIGLSHDIKLVEPDINNASLSGASSELMRHLPLDGLPEPHRHIVQKTFENLEFKNGSMSKPILFSPSQRQQVWDIFASENRILAQKLFSRDRLFDDAVPTGVGQMPVLSETGVQVVKDYFGPFILHLSKSGYLKTA